MSILKSKTFWAALGLAVVGGIKASGIDLPVGITEILAGLTAIFLRMGVTKSAPK